MGSYDGAEVYQLVGLYLLNLLTNEFGKGNIGLYRDDGLSCFQNISDPDSEKIKKKMCKILKEMGCYDVLDVTFDLKSDTHFPTENRTMRYCMYINNRSIHHP